MTYRLHRDRHVSLHQALDELITDFMAVTGKLPSNTTISELMVWSNAEKEKPTTIDNITDIHEIEENVF